MAVASFKTETLTGKSFFCALTNSEKANNTESDKHFFILANLIRLPAKMIQCCCEKLKRPENITEMDKIPPHTGTIASTIV